MTTTPNLGLTQYAGTDKINFLTQYNTDLSKIDTTTGKLSNLTTASKTNLVSATNENVTNIGTLSSLKTTNKTNLVGATNENVTNIGALASLTTTEKTNLVGAVNELDGDITAINNNLVWITINLATAITAGITYEAGSWIKYNPMTKELIGNIFMTSSVNNQTVFLTLPSNIPLSSQSRLAGIGSYASQTVQALVILNTNRTLKTSYSSMVGLSNVDYIINIVL